MADDLDDEWWLEEKELEDTELEAKAEKRRRTEKGVEARVTHQIDGDHRNKEKAKKRRKKPKIESITTELHGSKVPDVLWTTFCDCTTGLLSTLELEDIMFKDSCCLVEDSTHTGALEELLPYLNRVIPHWSGNVSKLDKKGDKGCPILLFVSSAATRVVELNRSAAEFKGNCKTVKLFAKHVKWLAQRDKGLTMIFKQLFQISEQEQFLESHVVHFGIGTPSRILRLLQTGSLKTSRMKYLILDWTWRDKKLRRMIDIPEVRGELISLLKDFIFPLAKASKLKIGLF